VTKISGITCRAQQLVCKDGVLCLWIQPQFTGQLNWKSPTLV